MSVWITVGAVVVTVLVVRLGPAVWRKLSSKVRRCKEIRQAVRERREELSQENGDLWRNLEERDAEIFRLESELAAKDALLRKALTQVKTLRKVKK